MKSYLYIGDSIQTMLDGRNMVMGLDADRVLNLQVDESTPAPTAAVPYAAATLSLLFAIADTPPGTYTCKLSLIDAGGRSYPSVIPEPVVVVVTCPLPAVPT